MEINQCDQPDGSKSYHILLDGTENANFRQILEGWLDALELHEERSKDYPNREEFTLGLAGEFVGFWRKAQKLKAEVWDKSHKLTREGVQEVLMDCMGSVGLMLSEQRKLSDKYSARWRDNHGSKPNFGPGPAAHPTDGDGGNKKIPGSEHVHEFIGRPRACVCGVYQSLTPSEAEAYPNLGG